MNVDQWNERYAGKELVWSASPNQYVETELKDLAPGRALDLAAGEGRNALWLASLGWKAHAVDFSQVALDRGQQLAAERDLQVQWEQADLDSWCPEPRGYDLVLLAYLHLPWPAMQPILRRAAEAVADGGTLLLVGHDRRNLEEGYGGPPSAAVLYGPQDVSAELPGLQIERAETVERRVTVNVKNGDGDGDERIALDVLVRARR